METVKFIKKIKAILGVDEISTEQLTELVELQLQVEEDMIIRPVESKRGGIEL